MLDLSSLQYSSENPAIVTMVFTVLCSIILGIMIAFTYDKTSRSVDRPDNFLQAMVLITIVAATIMQAIGDSIARGLGMLGALSIIRFRTTVRNPRNIVFIFGAIAAGIACGVLGFSIAILGTTGFCLTAFLLRLSSFSPKESFVGKLNLRLPGPLNDYPEVRNTLHQYCINNILIRHRISTDKKKVNTSLYEFDIKLKKKYSGVDLLNQMKQFENIKVTKLLFISSESKSI